MGQKSNATWAQSSSNNIDLSKSFDRIPLAIYFFTLVFFKRFIQIERMSIELESEISDRILFSSLDAFQGLPFAVRVNESRPAARRDI